MNTLTRSLRFLLVFTGALACMFAASHPASAAWPAFGRVVIHTLGAQENSALTTDGAGGAIIAWQDSRILPSVIAVHHVLASGELDPAWPHLGRAVLGAPLTNPDGEQTAPQVIPDGVGGAIVVWHDGRTAATGVDLFAQHVLANGKLDNTWPIDGAPVSVIAGSQVGLAVVSDGAGGAIVAWQDDRPGASEIDIYAQHVLSIGVVDPRWPATGAPVCTAAGAQQYGFQPVIAADGSGGAIITWFDSRLSPTELDIFAQRIQNNGTVAPGWPVNGRAVCTATFGQNFPTIVSDGEHGALIAWSDNRNLVDVRIFAQHVLGSGVVDPAWPQNGRDLSGVTAVDSRALAVADGAGGAVVAWERFSGQTTIGHIFAQHVRANGVVDPAWPTGGRALSQDQSDQTHAEIASDGTGGAIVVWDENNQHLFAQHVLAGGTLDLLYPANGRPMCNLPNRQKDAAIVGDGMGGAIVSWTDNRFDATTDIFSLQVTAAGADAPSGVRTPAISAIQVNVLPNPFNGSTHISFNSPADGQADIRIFDVTGRPVRSFSVSPGGGDDVLWDGRTSDGETVPSGVYFCRVSTPAGQAVQRMVLVR